MKHKCIVKIDDDIYSEIVFISNIIGVSVPDFISQLLVTDEFKKTISTIFNNLSQEAVKRTLAQLHTKDRKPQ